MALVSKILETTLTAGSTAVTFTDSDIPNSLLRVFSSNSDVIPESRILSGNTLTVTYAPQTSNMDVALEIVKQGLDIVDNVLSTDTDKALSAKQGYLLNAAIGDINDRLDGLVIPENVTDLDDVDVTSIQDGQVLAWDAVSEKFVNVNQSGGASVIYSYDERLIGQWVDGSNLYEKTIDIGTLPSSATSQSYPHGISGNIVHYNASAIDTVGTVIQLPFYTTAVNYNIGIYVTTTNVVIETQRNSSGYTHCYVTLQYTKNA